MTQDGNIRIKNIYYMLSYAFHALNQSDSEYVEQEEFSSQQNLYASVLGKGIGQLVKQGLFREYHGIREDLQELRGKIDLSGTARHKAAHKQVLSCEHDELTENCLLNQIIKTVALFLIRSDEVDAKYKDILRKEMPYFSEVDRIDPAAIPWGTLHFHRNNQTYRMLVGICQLVLWGMLQTTEPGRYKLAGFVDDRCMNQLYEKFILEYYRKEYPQLHASASQIPWALDDGMGEMLPTMQSDIMLEYKDTVLIIDAKYYSHTTQMYHDTHTIDSPNLYQIFAYVKNKEAQFGGRPHMVSGMLLYARTDENIQPNHSYKMSGNRIDVRTLDLNCEFKVIREQLDGIATEFFELLRAR